MAQTRRHHAAKQPASGHWHTATSDSARADAPSAVSDRRPGGKLRAARPGAPGPLIVPVAWHLPASHLTDRPGILPVGTTLHAPSRTQ